MSSGVASDKFKRSSSNPGAVLNVDSEALEAYRRKKRRSSEIDSMRAEIDSIKSTQARIETALSEMREVLVELARRT